MVIDSFSGENAFLSNFFDTNIIFDGIMFISSEAAYQAQKTLDLEERRQFTLLHPGKAKRMGRKVTLRSDWEDVKLKVMEDICRAKFTQNEELKKKLIDTGNAALIEGNTWNDTFWGVCNGVGENNLGKILMKIREELKD